MEYLDLMIELVRLLKPKNYIELGVKDGYTFNTISKLVEKSYAVDIKYKPSLNIGPTSEFFEMPTSEFYMHFFKRKELVDLIFIDADHSEEAVLGDVMRMKTILRPYSGLMLLHDTYPINKELLADGYCSTAWKAAKYLRKLDGIEICTIPGPWAGLTLVRTIPNNRHGWMDYE